MDLTISCMKKKTVPEQNKSLMQTLKVSTFIVPQIRKHDKVS